MTVLEVENLSKRFFLHEQAKEIQATATTSFEVTAGKLAALTGPSGAGKTTILNCIYRTCLPSAGQVRFQRRDGSRIDLAEATEPTVLELRRAGELSFVTQFLRFLPRKTTIEVVGQPLVEAGVSTGEARDRAAEQLQRFSLPEALWSISPATFSGGERQRVNLARGFVNRPHLLLLDEPTASLDHGTAERVIENIEEAKTDGVAMLAIFHDPVLIERLADQHINVGLS